MKKNAEMKMLVVLFHTVVFIMAACSPIAPTTIPSPLPTETLKATATLSPTITLTPEPTATFTETPLPDIGLSKVIVLNPDGSPLLTPWGSVKIDVQKSFDDFPQIETLEAQLGVLGKGWTPEFIGKWHSYLEQATVGGVPVVVPFDPNTVCTNVTWNTDYSDYGKIGTLDEWFINPSSCQAGTFPTRFVGSFYDNRPRIIGAAGETLRYPIIGVTFALWNPDLKKTVLQTYAHAEVGNRFLMLASEGAYIGPQYNIKPGVMPGSRQMMMDWFSKLSQTSGVEIYNVETANEAGAVGPYDPRLSGMVNFGTPNIARLVP